MNKKKLEIIKILYKLEEKHRNTFMKMYSFDNLDKSIDDVVRDLKTESDDNALRICKNTYHKFFYMMKR